MSASRILSVVLNPWGHPLRGTRIVRRSGGDHHPHRGPRPDPGPRRGAGSLGRPARDDPADLPGQFQPARGGFPCGLASLGVGQDQIRAALDQISFSSIASLLGGLLAGLASTFSNLLFLLFVVVFMALDAVGFSGRLSRARQQRAEVVGALDTFVHGTRSYLLVSTLFGLIVARIRCLHGSLHSDPSSVRSARPHVIATHQGARVRVAGWVH